MQPNKCQMEKYNHLIENKGEEINFESFTEKATLIGHSQTVYRIDICQKRNLLVSGSCDKTVKLWNLENNSLIQTYKNHPYAWDVVFSNNGNLLAFGGDIFFNNWPVSLVDITDLNKEHIISQLNGHLNRITQLTFSNDSKYLISASADKTVKIWDCQSKEEIITLQQQDSAVMGVAIRTDDTVLATISEKGKLRLWNLSNKQRICTQQAHESVYCGIQFSNNQKMLISNGNDGIIKLWSLESINSRKLVLIRQFNTGKNKIWYTLFQPFSRFIISIICNKDYQIKVFDQSTGQFMKQFNSNQIENRPWYHDITAISKNMDIIAYSDTRNIEVLRRMEQ